MLKKSSEVTPKAVVRNRRSALEQAFKEIDEFDFKGTEDYYPKLEFIKFDTDINDQNTRKFYLWVLANLVPFEDADFECEKYIIEQLIAFNNTYYGLLPEVLRKRKAKKEAMLNSFIKK